MASEEKPVMLQHERLDCYRLAVGVANWAAEQHIPVSRKHLRDQLTRAADSVVLNIAEAVGQRGEARRNHFRIAMGSAAETAAVLDLVRLPDGPGRQAEVRRVVQMLAKLSRL
jgi:four helix bundle protein